ncbi:MAG: 30S ribosomal protein S4 [Chloroflexi bacterium]|nr:30S ribosomal protein S4 [Chloroflexota bacterium]
MARYTGPVCRICRRESVKLFLKGERCTTKCPLDGPRNAGADTGSRGSRRSAGTDKRTPPGMHKQRRRKSSEYADQLREKQKARKFYGVGERQFQKAFHEADRRSGPTGDNLFSIMESRLDNVVHLLGLGRSRPEARQIVRHGHVLVNGHKTDIPSYQVKAGDTISIQQSSREIELFKAIAEGFGNARRPNWLSFDADTWTGRVLSKPGLGDATLPVREQLVVEYYSR